MTMSLSIQLNHLIANSRKPLLVVGDEFDNPEGQTALANLLLSVKIPFVTSASAFNLAMNEWSVKYYFGPVGLEGTRLANTLLSMCDSLILLGTSGSIRTLGYDANRLLAEKTVIWAKKDRRNVNWWLEKSRDIKFVDLFSEMTEQNLSILENISDHENGGWATPIIKICDKYDKPQPRTLEYFVSQNTDFFKTLDAVVLGNTQSRYSVIRNLPLALSGLRVIYNCNYAPMGWDLPAALGVLSVCDDSRVLIVTGDGSIQMNLQDLAPLSKYKSRVTIVVVDNDGYESIAHSQEKMLGASNPLCFGSGGLPLPDLSKVLTAFGFDYYECLTGTDRIMSLPDQGRGAAICLKLPKVERHPPIYPQGKIVSLHDGWLNLVKQPFNSHDQKILEQL